MRSVRAISPGDETVMKYATPYIAAAVSLLALDIIWLGFIAKSLYRTDLGPLMADSVNIPAAVGFYLLYVVGLMIFVITPEIPGGSWQRAVLFGALFGFFAYMTYDLSNLATLRGVTWRLALTDMAWGAFASAAASLAGVLAGKAVNG